MGTLPNSAAAQDGITRCSPALVSNIRLNFALLTELSRHKVFVMLLQEPPTHGTHVTGYVVEQLLDDSFAKVNATALIASVNKFISKIIARMLLEGSYDFSRCLYPPPGIRYEAFHM